MTIWSSDRPKTRHDKAWYSEFAICPMCGGFTYPKYHSPAEVLCTSPAKGEHHNHMRCRCGYEWTLPPREGER